jgi:hypothetical protein
MKLAQNLSGVEAGLDFKSLPEGVYKAHITEARGDFQDLPGENVKESVSLLWTILEPEYEGAVVFDRLCLNGYKDTALTMSQRKLKTMAEAMGHPNPNYIEDTDELLQRACYIKVGFGKGEYKDKNQVNNYYSLNASPALLGVKTTTEPPKPAQAPPTVAPPKAVAPPKKASPPAAPQASTQAPPTAPATTPPPISEDSPPPLSPFEAAIPAPNTEVPF